MPRALPWVCSEQAGMVPPRICGIMPCPEHGLLTTLLASVLPHLWPVFNTALWQSDPEKTQTPCLLGSESPNASHLTQKKSSSPQSSPLLICPQAGQPAGLVLPAPAPRPPVPCPRPTASSQTRSPGQLWSFHCLCPKNCGELQGSVIIRFPKIASFHSWMPNMISQKNNSTHVLS